MKKLLTAIGAAALLAAGCASHNNNDTGMGGTSDTDMSGTTSQSTTSQDTLKTDSVKSPANGGSQNINGGNAGAPATGGTNDATSTPTQ